MFSLNERTTDYFSRSQMILRKSVFPGNNMLGAGADSMKSLSPSILKWRLCSVPFHSSFQEASTTVISRLPSTPYLPLYASIDLCSAATQFGWLQGSRKFLKEKIFWLRG